MVTRRTTRWFGTVLSGALAATLAVGCGSPSAPTPVLETETFTGTLTVEGFEVQTFTVNYSATPSDASMTVSSLVTTADRSAVTTTIGIGFGSIAGNGSCRLNAAHTATAALVGQELVASNAFAAGPYCLQVFDAGTLTEPLDYTIIVRHF